MNKLRGFTLIELLVAIAILGVLTSMALPAFQGMVASMRVRSTAESFNQGLQLARSEAIKRNARISFRFPATNGDAAGSWEVCASVSASTTYTCPSADVIQRKSSAEGSQNVTITPTPSGSTMTTFTGMGRQFTNLSALNNPDGTAEVTKIVFSSAETSKTYQVQITSAGNSKMCDPALPSSNVKGCPTP